MIRLHHGSFMPIDKIDLSASKAGKDFGRGFYLNPDYDEALLWAESRVAILNKGVPTITSYDFDLDKALADGLSVKIFDGYSPEWAEFVADNRRIPYKQPKHEFDIVIGPIADDNVGRQIQQYIYGNLTLVQLMDKLKYDNKRSIQYFFGTVKSLNYLRRLL